MKNINRLILKVAPFAALLSVSSVQAGLMQEFDPLPAPNCGTMQLNNCVQFGDFSVYSLGLLNAQAEYADPRIIPTTNPVPNDPYYVASSLGELLNDDYSVYGTCTGTGANNGKVVTNGDGSVIEDDAQQQPNGTTDTSSIFTVSPFTERGSLTSVEDFATSWDGQLSATRTELGAGR